MSEQSRPANQPNYQFLSSQPKITPSNNPILNPTQSNRTNSISSYEEQKNDKEKSFSNEKMNDNIQQKKLSVEQANLEM